MYILIFCVLLGVVAVFALLFAIKAKQEVLLLHKLMRQLDAHFDFGGAKLAPVINVNTNNLAVGPKESNQSNESNNANKSNETNTSNAATESSEMKASDKSTESAASDKLNNK